MSIEYTKMVQQMLQKIAIDYDLDIDELSHRYLKDAIFMQNKTDILQNTSSSLICMARKQDGTQCTRRKKQNCDYCGKHVTSRRYGRIDDNNTCKSLNVIKTKLENINGTDYLVDDNNIVFSYNVDKPSVIGYMQYGELIAV